MNKKVLITGATSGIGQGCAIKFAEEGYDVIVHSRSMENDFSVIKKIEEKGQKALKVAADFLNPDEIEKMFDFIKKEWGKIDVLVNNAGMVNRKKIAEFTAWDFQNLFMVNVTSQFLCARSAFNLGSSSIVNIGSMRGFSQEATTFDYSASKAAVHNLTVSLARALAPSCRVNCVAPGFTKTPIHDTSLERLQMEAKKTPLKDYAHVGEIAESVYFLASEKSSFTTGAVLLVDGGRNFV